MPVIHQEISLPATPAEVFDALMASDKHSAFTGAPAQIDAQEGGAWSAYGGGITGRNIELVPGQRIVQSWRPGNWPAGVHSVVRFELVGEGKGTRVVLDHSSFPPDAKPHLEDGWRTRYWGPLKAYFSESAD